MKTKPGAAGAKKQLSNNNIKNIQKRKNKDNFQVPNEIRLRLIELTDTDGLSIYKARQILGIKYSTAKQIVKSYRDTGKIERTNNIRVTPKNQAFNNDKNDEKQDENLVATTENLQCQENHTETTEDVQTAKEAQQDGKIEVLLHQSVQEYPKSDDQLLDVQLTVQEPEELPSAREYDEREDIIEPEPNTNEPSIKMGSPATSYQIDMQPSLVTDFSSPLHPPQATLQYMGHQPFSYPFTLVQQVALDLNDIQHRTELMFQQDLERHKMLLADITKL
jgi:transposase